MKMHGMWKKHHCTLYKYIWVLRHLFSGLLRLFLSQGHVAGGGWRDSLKSREHEHNQGYQITTLQITGFPNTNELESVSVGSSPQPESHGISSAHFCTLVQLLENQTKSRTDPSTDKS